MRTVDCPACGASEASRYGEFRDEEYFTSTELFPYAACGACGTVYIESPPVDRLGQIYPSNYYSFQGGDSGVIQRIKQWLDRRAFRSVLRGLRAPQLNVLDVGGGNGWLLDELRKLEPRIRFTQVVDLDEGAAQHARAKGHEYTRQRIEEFTSQTRFHLVMLMNLIEHVDAPRAVLANIASLLAPGGLVMIKTPNIDALDARLFRKTYWAGLHVPRHWVLFTRQSFARALEGTGLVIREFSYTQGAPFWAASVLASWKRRGWVDVSAARPSFYHPLFAPLAAVFAAFDLLRRPFARTSQMSLVLARAGDQEEGGENTK